jgi:hypothetical protein
MIIEVINGRKKGVFDPRTENDIHLLMDSGVKDITIRNKQDYTEEQQKQCLDAMRKLHTAGWKQYLYDKFIWIKPENDSTRI